MGVTIKWDITYRCNLNCNHCINGKYLNKDYNEIKFEDIKKIVNEILEVVDIEYIHFLGGEPTTRDDFLKICKFLNDLKIEFGFNSNGIKLRNSYVKELVNFKYLKKIVLSLESPIKDENDEIRGKNVFNCIESAIDIIKENFDRNVLAINMVLSKKNYKSVNSMIDYCLTKGVKELSFLQLIEQGNALNSNLSLSYDEIIDVACVIGSRSINDYKKLRISPKFLRPLTVDYINKMYDKRCPQIGHGCSAGMGFLYLDNEGFLYPCDRVKFKNLFKHKYSVLESDFKTMWAYKDMGLVFQKMESNKYRELYPCSKCKHFMDSCFPCSLDDFQMNNFQCKKTFELINKLLYDNIKVSYGPFREYKNNEYWVVYNCDNGNTIELDDKSKQVFDILKEHQFNDKIDYKHISEDINVNQNEIFQFIDYLSECNFLDNPNKEVVKCSKNIENF